MIFFYTYSLVTKIATIRTLVALASTHGLVVHQMDIKTTFLNGKLDEEIYVEQPEGFIVLSQENKVCRLRKTLYGPKQASKQWYEMFDKTLVSNGYSVNTSDSYVYFKIECDYVIICLYVDDMLMFGNNVNVVNETKLFLSSHFGMKDLREAYMILGIKLRKTDNDFSLCQSHYIEKILKMFNYFDEMHVRTSYDSSIHLRKNKRS